jgi:hypothetical protein
MPRPRAGRTIEGVWLSRRGRVLVVNWKARLVGVATSAALVVAALGGWAGVFRSYLDW